MYAVVLPRFGGSAFAYKVPLSNQGMEEFVSVLAFSPFSPVLFSGNSKPDWIIMSLESEFHIVAGTPRTVECLIGTSSKEAFLQFRTFADRFNISDSAIQTSELARQFYSYYSFL